MSGDRTAREVVEEAEQRLLVVEEAEQQSVVEAAVVEATAGEKEAQ